MKRWRISKRAARKRQAEEASNAGPPPTLSYELIGGRRAGLACAPTSVDVIADRVRIASYQQGQHANRNGRNAVQHSRTYAR